MTNDEFEQTIALARRYYWQLTPKHRRLVRTAQRTKGDVPPKTSKPTQRG